MRAVVPRIGMIAQDMVNETGFTNRSLGTSTFIFTLASNWSIVESAAIGLLALLIAGFFILQLRGLESLREAILRHTPGFAQVYWSSVVARFAHTSALAASSGTPLPELLAASGQASGSPALAEATQRVSERLKNGDALDAAAARERDVPALWTCAVLAAGPRGDLPAALAEIARTYELRAQHWVNTLRAFIGPLLFLVLTIGIGGLVVCILVAINALLHLFMAMTSF
jgi:type II secretory pathway component PulF